MENTRLTYEKKLTFYQNWSGCAARDLWKIQIIYNTLNKLYFRSELPQIPLLITTTFKGMTDEGESEDEDGFFCYNINKKGREYIVLSIFPTGEIEDVLLHEMLHFYNYLHDIEDYDDNKDGDKHTQKFIDQAKALKLPFPLWNPDESDANLIISGVQYNEDYLDAIITEIFNSQNTQKERKRHNERQRKQ